MENQEVCLSSEGKEYTVKKDLLIEYSDYFRAMFSGNFIEKEQQKICIDVVDLCSMELILQYMHLGFIDLSIFSLATVGNLYSAAIYLQVTKLCKQIDHCVRNKLSVKNWIDIVEIAQKAPARTLERYATNYGLMAFKHMKPEYIPSVHKLFWYLSHPYLNAESELEVFKFGVEWLELNNLNGHGLLTILSCLDYDRLRYCHLAKMRHNTIMKDGDFICDDSSRLAHDVINSLLHISKDSDCSITSIKENMERIYKDDKNLGEKYDTLAFNIVRESIQRKLKLTPLLPMWTFEGSIEGKAELSPNYLYTYSHETGFNKWLEISTKNHWGWSLTSWSHTKIVICGGEHGRGTGKFMRDVKVYDIHKKEWIHHGVQLPIRRHAGVVVLGDELYILGGVGGYRVVLDSATIYNLKERTFRPIANLPDAIQSPAVCVHENEVYMISHKHIYKYVGTGIVNDRWEQVLETDIRPNLMVSLNGYIYVAHNYFSWLYRFKPGKDLKLEEVATFEIPPTNLCVMGSEILTFTLTVDEDDDNNRLTVEEYHGANASGFESRKVRCSQTFNKCGVHTTGCCVVLLDPPPIDTPGISEFHQEILKKMERVLSS